MPDEPLAHAILILSKALVYNVTGMPFTKGWVYHFVPMIKALVFIGVSERPLFA